MLSIAYSDAWPPSALIQCHILSIQGREYLRRLSPSVA